MNVTILRENRFAVRTILLLRALSIIYTQSKMLYGVETHVNLKKQAVEKQYNVYFKIFFHFKLIIP